MIEPKFKVGNSVQFEVHTFVVGQVLEVLRDQGYGRGRWVYRVRRSDGHEYTLTQYQLQEAHSEPPETQA